jgi:hypothetical protein
VLRGIGQSILIASSLPTGDQWYDSRDTSIFREGSCSLTQAGALGVLIGDLCMKYWTHNAPMDSNGNFLGRDDAGASTLICFTEGPGAALGYWMRFDAVTGTAGSVPSFTLSEVGGPQGIQVINNNASAIVTIPMTAPTFTSYLSMTGTNQASVQFVFPAIAAVSDGFRLTIYTAAAIGTAVTYSSTGGTFPGAPATLAAGGLARFIKQGTTWLPA